MPSQKCKQLPTQGLFIVFLLIIFICNGCARSPWRHKIDEDSASPLRTHLLDFNRKSKICPSDFDAITTITWESTFKKESTSGFIQVLRPSHIKIVAINPLGQPFIALSSNGRSFQAINTFKKEFYSGKLTDFALKYNISGAIIGDNWGNHLYGLPPQWTEGTEILNDDSSRGYWVKTVSRNGNFEGREYTLLAFDNYRLLTRILTDAEDRIITRIDYSQWQKLGFCLQPTKLLITGLAKGFKATLELEDILVENHFTVKDFIIKKPSGYNEISF